MSKASGKGRWASYPGVIRQYLGGIMRMLGDGAGGPVLDLGCGSGEYTAIFASELDGVEVIGMDIDPPALKKARDRGLKVIRADADSPLPFPAGTFSVVLTTQVVEHMYHPDRFADEVQRVLKDDGYAVIATENLASWHNVASLALGYQPSTENVSDIRRIGNPFAGNYGEVPEFDNLHIKVFTYVSFLEFLRLHGFEIVEGHGYGYHPLPSRISGWASRLDPRHSRYIAAKVRKVRKS